MAMAMSITRSSMRALYHHLPQPQPFASSSSSSARIISRWPTRRSAHALAQEAPQYEPAPGSKYVGAVDGKGKERAVEGSIPSGAISPRRKVEIKAKKSAISMTPAAITRLRELVSSPTEPKLLRIGVKTRGCAGMAYHLDYVPPPGGRFDEVVEQDGVKVLIDSKALFSIIGSVMDWRDTRLTAGFVFDK